MGLLRGRRAATGDERAARFRSVFDDNHRAVLAYALRRTATPEDAADVLAETMLVAWRRIDEVPADEASRLWLFGVARKVLGNHRRGALRRDRLGERLAAGIESALPDTSETFADALWVRAALVTLGDDDREVLTLTLWEGLTPSQVAAALDMPAATVRTRLHRARARMRIELEASPGERSAPAGQEQGDGQPPVRDTEEVT